MKNKERIMLVMSYLKENSDEQHKITAEQIINYLTKNHSINVDRKTIYNDINTLNNLGYSIECTRQGYYWDNNIFEITELRILIDAVRASSFLSAKKSDLMIEKLLSLTNCYERKLADSGDYNNTKTTNEQIYYNIFNVINAISKKQAITFKYYDLGVRKEKKYRKHDYEVFPLDLLINQDRYYMICYSKKYNGLNNYRIDKMEQVELKDEYIDRVDFDVNEYMRQTFSMYPCDKTNVILKCHCSLIDEIYTRFDNKVLVTKIENDYYYCNIDISASQTFLGWLFSYNGKIIIEQPQILKDEFINMCKKMIELHQ
ncbi:MAG: WYL domain-containing protein [Erysipelotrichia bacterium]|nr:WYL domain-containing protein [Erysipelotrichia bacterium]